MPKKSNIEVWANGGHYQEIFTFDRAVVKGDVGYYVEVKVRLAPSGEIVGLEAKSLKAKGRRNYRKAFRDEGVQSYIMIIDGLYFSEDV